MPSWAHRITFKKIITYSVLIILWILLAISIGHLKPKTALTEGWDFEKFWAAPRLLLQGMSPYDTGTWLALHASYPYPPQNNAFIYPLPFAILLIPLGFLSLENAAVVWAAILIAAFFASIYLILPRDLNWPLSYAIPVYAGLVLFRATMVNFYLLQIDILILLCLAASFHLWQHDRMFWGGLIISLIALKPQVGALILIFIVLWQLFRKNWYAILGECTGLVLLFLSGILIDPAWVQHWLASSEINLLKFLFSTPSIWGLSSLLCRQSITCVSWLGIFLSIAAIIFTLAVILPKPMKDISFVLSVVICTSLVISPYLWTYSQVILILPILWINISFFRLKMPYLITATFSLVVALFSSILVGLSIRIGADVISAFVPILIGILALFINKKDPALLRMQPYSPKIVSPT